MKFLSKIKNNYLALSKSARIIYTIAVIAFCFMTFKFISAYVTPAPIEKKRELDGRVSARADIEILKGQETSNYAKDQTDPLLEIAKDVESEKSKDDFNKTGIGTENIQLAAWTDESKTLINPSDQQASAANQTNSAYILRDATSQRLPETLAGRAFSLGDIPSNNVLSKPADYKKEFANLDPEATKKVVTAMAKDLASEGANWKAPAVNGQSYVKGNIEQYNWEVNNISPVSVQESEYQQKIAGYVTAQHSDSSKGNSQQQSRRDQSIDPTNKSQSGSVQTGGVTDVASASSQTSLSLGRGLLPGDILPCTLIFAINSDLSSVSACEVVRGPLKGSIIGLNVQREEEYVTLAASGITFNDYYDSISGIAISMEAYGTTGIRSDIDRHTLSRWSSLLFAGAFDGVWELYRQPRQQTIVTDSGIVQTTQEPTDRQVLLAALSRPASILTQSAAKNFEKPNTIYVHRGELVGIYIQQPFNKEWLPDVSKNAKKIVY